MTYSQLEDLIDGMTDEQKAMTVVINVHGEYVESDAVSEITFSTSEDFYKAGQIVLLA